MRFGLLHALAKHMDVINKFALFRVLNVAGDITDKHNEGHFPYKDVIIWVTPHRQALFQAKKARINLIISLRGNLVTIRNW